MKFKNFKKIFDSFIISYTRFLKINKFHIYFKPSSDYDRLKRPTGRMDRQLGHSNGPFEMAQENLPVGGSGSLGIACLGRCKFGNVPVLESVSWGIDSTNLTLISTEN